VISREERRALIDLEQLLASDLTKSDMETLIKGVQQAEHVYDEAQKWSGQLVAELKRRGLSWPVLAKMTGVPQTNLTRRARPYLREDDPS